MAADLGGATSTARRDPGPNSNSRPRPTPRRCSGWAWLKIQRGPARQAGPELRRIRTSRWQRWSGSRRSPSCRAGPSNWPTSTGDRPARGFARRRVRPSTRAEILNEQARRRASKRHRQSGSTRFGPGASPTGSRHGRNPLEIRDPAGRHRAAEAGCSACWTNLVIRVRLRLTSRMPLGLGPDRPAQLATAPPKADGRVGSETVRRRRCTAWSASTGAALMPREGMTINVNSRTTARRPCSTGRRCDGINVPVPRAPVSGQPRDVREGAAVPVARGPTASCGRPRDTPRHGLGTQIGL